MLVIVDYSRSLLYDTLAIKGPETLGFIYYCCVKTDMRVAHMKAKAALTKFIYIYKLDNINYIYIQQKNRRNARDRQV